MKKRISGLLALLMVLALIPTPVLATAAKEGWRVLFEPQFDGFLGGPYGELTAYGDTAAVYSVSDKAYHLVRFTGSGFEEIPGTYGGAKTNPQISADYICVPAADDFNTMWGVIDKTGETIIDFDYDYIECPDDNGFALAHRTEGDDIIQYRLNLNTRQAEPIVPGEQFLDDKARTGYSVQRTEDGVTQLTGAGGAVVFSSEGKDYELNPSVESLKAGLVGVFHLETHKYGFVNLRGEEVTPPQYDWIEAFHNGYSRAGMDWHGKSILLDTEGSVVIPYGQYYRISRVSPDRIVWVADKEGPTDSPDTWYIDGDYTKVSILKLDGGSAAKGPEASGGLEAVPTNDKLTVNGVEYSATVYKIGESNYFKIRDVAAMLSGTGKQFGVTYDTDVNAVSTVTGMAYTPVGGELAGAASGAQTAQASNDAIIVNGLRADDISAYKIDGSNYFKLRDLGAVLGFDVGWTREQGMFINTGG